MILALIVLCSFSVSLVNLKLNNLNPFQKWWVTSSEYAAAFLASNYYCSNEGKALTKAIPLLAACLKRSASCLRAAVVVNFCQEIFLAQCEFLTSRTTTSRADCCKSWSSATTYPAFGNTQFYLGTTVRQQHSCHKRSASSSKNFFACICLSPPSS